MLFLIIARRFWRGRKIAAVLRLEALTTRRLVIISLLGAFLFRGLMTGLQYYVWQSSSFGHFLLPPYQPWGYFINYSFFHFWLYGLITLFIASALYLIFRLIGRRRPEVAADEDLGLLFIFSLLPGWPRSLAFAVIFLSVLLLFSVVRTIQKKKETGIIWPLIISEAAAWLFGNYLFFIGFPAGI